MSLNLVRNSKVFFTTNVDATTGRVNLPATAAFTNANTFELLVLDGFTFSQTVNSETVTVSEAGNTPTRGQRNFNTSLAPVDFSMSTYIRPSQLTSSPFTVECDESILWNALFSDVGIPANAVIGGITSITYAESTGTITINGTTLTFTGSITAAPTVGSIINLGGLKPSGSPTADTVKKLNGAARVASVTGVTQITLQLLDPLRTSASFTGITSVTYTTSAWARSLEENSLLAHSSASSGLSDKNQLQKFGMLFLVDNVLYAVDNCALNQVTIDFGLDQIATAQWTGQATALRELSRAVKASGGNFSGGTTTDVGAAGAYKTPNNNAGFITNKLSTAALKALKAIGTNISANDSYTIPITGGSITINNNISYITPATLGIVNSPITYFTGTRAVTGSLTAYLRTPTTGSTNTGELFKDLIAEASAASSAMIEPMFEMGIQIGGSSNAVRVDLDMPAVSLSIPAVNVEQIVSLTINFTAQGYAYNSTQANQNFDLTVPNEIDISYFG